MKLRRSYVVTITPDELMRLMALAGEMTDADRPGHLVLIETHEDGNNITIHMEEQ